VIALARVLARIVGFVVLVALAAAGIVLAVFCIGTGTHGPSLGGLARLLSLASVRDSVGHRLTRLEEPGSVAVIAGLCGLGAIALGILLIAGVLVPRRERLVQLTDDEQGALAARRRPLAQVATALVEQVRGVTEARVRVRPFRRTGGRLSVRASRSRRADADEVRRAVSEKLESLTQPFKLKARVDVPRRGARVE
jgi:Family of unknown function (DUF6286)